MIDVLLRSSEFATEGTEVLVRNTEVATEDTEVLLRGTQDLFYLKN